MIEQLLSGSFLHVFVCLATKGFFLSKKSFVYAAPNDLTHVINFIHYSHARREVHPHNPQIK